MKYFVALALSVLLTELMLCNSVAVAEAHPGQHVHFVQYQDAKQWCAFHDGTEAQAEIDRLVARSVATIVYKNERLTEIEENSAVDSGDYAISLTYSLDQDGNITRMERRTYDYGVIAVEIYAFTDGRVRKINAKFLDPKSHKPVVRPKDLYLNDDFRIRRSLKDFPFFALIESPAIRTAVKICAPDLVGDMFGEK